MSTESKNTSALAVVPPTSTELAVVPSALALPAEGSNRATRHQRMSEDIAALILADEAGAVTVCFRGRTLRPGDILGGLKKRAAKEANAWLDEATEDNLKPAGRK